MSLLVISKAHVCLLRSHPQKSTLLQTACPSSSATLSNCPLNSLVSPAVASAREHMQFLSLYLNRRRIYETVATDTFFATKRWRVSLCPFLIPPCLPQYQSVLPSKTFFAKKGTPHLAKRQLPHATLGSTSPHHRWASSLPNCTSPNKKPVSFDLSAGLIVSRILLHAYRLAPGHVALRHFIHGRYIHSRLGNIVISAKNGYT